MKTLTLMLFLAAAPAAAGPIDDSDLSSPGLSAQSLPKLKREGRLEAGAAVFPLVVPGLKPTPPKLAENPVVTGSLLLADRGGTLKPARLARARLAAGQGPWTQVDADGRFSLPRGAAAGTARVRFSLDNAYWAFKNPDAKTGYEWESAPFALPESGGVDLGALSPDPASENGKLGVLHLTYVEALGFLEKNADVAWWTKTLTVNWPGSSDHFSPWAWSVDLTNPLAWDVILHELGHAVMHGSMRLQSAGGQHKIDECYNAALAWSEGYATFFAAAVRLGRGEEDAKFEFLVPRRAPIRLENVPEDVCRGENNEWRVAAALWDLFDTHADGKDAAAFDFGKVWRPLRDQSMGSYSTAYALIAKTLDAGQLRLARDASAWNTVLKAAPELLVSLPALPAGWAKP